MTSTNSTSKKQAHNDFSRHMGRVVKALLGEPNRHHSKPNKPRWGTNGSLSVDLTKGTYFDHEAKEGGGVLDLIKREKGLTGKDAIDFMRQIGCDIPETKKKTKRTLVDTFDYHDRDGNVVFHVLRYEPKEFKQCLADGTWKGGPLIPYRLPKLIEAIAQGQTIFIVEGERKVHALENWGLVATCNAGGSKQWKSEHSEYLRGADVVTLPDNDEPGRAHVDVVTDFLKGIAKSVRILELPGLGPKGDIINWIADGGTKEEFLNLVDETKPIVIEDDQKAGERMLDAVHEFIGRFVAYPSVHARVAHSLWIVHTHLMDKWESTPRLAFLSAEPASGKTRALEVAELLVPNPVSAVNVSPAYLFRKVGSGEIATILFDEIDTVFGPKAKENEEIRGLLNAGHRRGAVAGRCVMSGKTPMTEEIPAYAAVALAGLGWLPDTILSRSVIIRMRRRHQDEQVEQFRRRIQVPVGTHIRRMIEAWARAQHGDVAWPELPSEIQDRDADVWEPLIVVADLVGGEWPARARAAAKHLVSMSKEVEPSIGIRLLADLRTVFGDLDAMASKVILTALHSLPESPWADIKAGKPLDERGLAKRLREYGIKSKNIAVGKERPKGYTRVDLYDAWGRYLPRLTPSKSATSTTNATSEENQGDEVADQVADVADEVADRGADADDVADREVGVADKVADPLPEKPNKTGPEAHVAEIADLAGVCAQCGAPNDLGSYQNGAGKTVLLHAECVRFWEDQFWKKEDLDIPDFLRRELTDTGEAA